MTTLSLLHPTRSQRSWMRCWGLVLLCLFAAAVFGGGNRGGSSSFLGPDSVTAQATETPSGSSESSAPENDESFGPAEVEVTTRQRKAIKVAEHVAMVYGGFPSTVGTLGEVVDHDLELIKKEVGTSLYDDIEKEWSQGRPFVMQATEAVVQPGTTISSPARNEVDVVVTVSTSLANGDPSTEVPLASVLNLKLRSSKKKWKVVSINK